MRRANELGSAAAIDTYMEAHVPDLEKALTRAMNQAAKDQAPDLIARVGELLLQASKSARAAASSSASPAAATTPIDTKDVGPTEWTTAGWLASTGGAIDALSLSLSSGRAPEQSELEFVRGLGAKYAGDAAGGRAEILALLREGGALEAVAEALWAGIEQLTRARAATGVELQTKFLQEGAGLLSYGGLHTFYGGLGARIGDPNANVDDQMAREHTECGDAHE